MTNSDSGQVRQWIYTQEGGQAYIEFLIVFPVLFLIFMGVVFFGKGYSARAQADIAVRYAAWKNGRSHDSVDAKRASELFFPGEGSRLSFFDPGPPAIAGLDELKDVSGVMDKLGKTEEAGLYYVVEAPYFFPGARKIAAAHYVTITGWDETTQFAAAGLWGLGIAKGLSSAKTPGTCGGGTVKSFIELFAKAYLEKKADEAVASALEAGLKKMGDIIMERIEGWIGDIRGRVAGWAG